MVYIGISKSYDGNIGIIETVEGKNMFFNIPYREVKSVLYPTKTDKVINYLLLRNKIKKARAKYRNETIFAILEKPKVNEKNLKVSLDKMVAYRMIETIINEFNIPYVEIKQNCYWNVFPFTRAPEYKRASLQFGLQMAPRNHYPLAVAKNGDGLVIANYAIKNNLYEKYQESLE